MVNYLNSNSAFWTNFDSALIFLITIGVNETCTCDIRSIFFVCSILKLHVTIMDVCINTLESVVDWNVLFDPCEITICIASYSIRYIFRKVFATDILFLPLQFIPHHFSMYKYILIFCTTTVLTLRDSIPHVLTICTIKASGL